MRSSQFGEGRRVVARLSHGADLLAEIKAVAEEHWIRMGVISAVGALQRARLASYGQTDRSYHEYAVDEPVEILALEGNISMRDGEPFVHAHITLSDDQGRAFGGHVMPGCIIFACELFVLELGGDELERTFDSETGLTLWSNF